jgi:hypothetical protein
MPDKVLSRERYGEAFWRAHHEAWRHSEQLAGEVQSRAQPPSPKLLYRRGGLSHSLSHRLSHMTYGSPAPVPIIPPAREGRRLRFSETDKRKIVEETMRPDARLSEVARCYGKYRHAFCFAGSRS